MASSTSASPERPAPVDVLVVGAGPGGSAAAALLARAGFSVTAVDRAAFPRDKACSEYMSPEAVRLLDRLGVVPELEAAGAAPLHGTRVIAARGSRLHGRFAHAGVTPFRPTGLSLSRRLLDDTLVGAARGAGATVLERTAVEELLYDGGAVAGAVVRDADGQRHVLRARLTIGADGLRSLVARRIGRRRHGHPRRLAFVAHVDGVTGMGDSAEMHVGRQGYVGLNPIGGGRTNVALVVPAERGARGARPHGGVPARGAAGVSRAARAGRGRRAGPAGARHRTVRGLVRSGDGRRRGPGGRRRRLLRSVHRRGDLQRASRRGAPGRGGGPGARRGRDLSPRPISRGYRRARRRAFAGKWAVERLIGYGMLFPALFDRAVARLGRRAGMADTLIGVTGDFVPARQVLNPLFLARMIL